MATLTLKSFSSFALKSNTISKVAGVAAARTFATEAAPEDYGFCKLS